MSVTREANKLLYVCETNLLYLVSVLVALPVLMPCHHILHYTCCVKCYVVGTWLVCDRYVIGMWWVCDRHVVGMWSCDWYVVGMRSVCDWYVVGMWSVCDRCVIGMWSVCDRCVIGTWLVCDRCVIDTWLVCDRYVVSAGLVTWLVCGQYVLGVWSVIFFTWSADYASPTLTVLLVNYPSLLTAYCFTLNRNSSSWVQHLKLWTSQNESQVDTN